MLRIFSKLGERFQSLSVQQNAFNIGLLFTSSRIIGTLRESIISRAVSRDIYDMYTVAVKIPSMIRRLSSEGTLENAYVPSLVQFPPSEEFMASKWIAGIAAVIFSFSSIIVYFCIATVSFWSNLLLDKSYSLANVLVFKELFIIMLPIILGYFLSSTFIAILHKHEYFIHANLGQSIANIFMVITAYIGYKISNSHLVLAICTLAGATAHLMWQYYGVCKIGKEISISIKSGFRMLLIGWTNTFIMIFKILKVYSLSASTMDHLHLLTGSFPYQLYQYLPNIHEYLVFGGSTLPIFTSGDPLQLLWLITLLSYSIFSLTVLFRNSKNSAVRLAYLTMGLIPLGFVLSSLFKVNSLVYIFTLIFELPIFIGPLLVLLGIKATLPKSNELQYGRLNFGPKLQFVHLPQIWLFERIIKSILNHVFPTLIIIDVLFNNSIYSKILVLILSLRNAFFLKDFDERLPLFAKFGKYVYLGICLFFASYTPFLIILHLINNFIYLYRYNKLLEKNNPIIKQINSRFLGIASNAFFGTGIHQIMSLVSVMVSVKIGSGAPSYMNRADKIMQFPIGILGVSFGMALLPRISTLIVEKRYKEADKLYTKLLANSIFMSIMVILLSLFIAEPVANFFFFGGKTTNEDICVICNLFKLQLIALPSSIVLKTLYPIYFSLNRSEIVSWAALLQCAVDVSLKILFLILKRDIYWMTFGWIVGSWISAIYLFTHKSFFLQKSAQINEAGSA